MFSELSSSCAQAEELFFASEFKKFRPQAQRYLRNPLQFFQRRAFTGADGHPL